MQSGKIEQLARRLARSIKLWYYLMYKMANMEKFSNIAGQEFAKKFISLSLKKNRIAHAYLFVGPAAVGKFRFAVEFAKIIQCGAGYTDSKDEKIIERSAKIEAGSDPDVSLFDNSFFESGDSEEDSDTHKSITVAEVRKIEHYLSLSPYQSKYKIAIIRNAHLFTIEAANAFLKTMEEPRGDSIIILIADNINSLPKTLISRAQMIRFGTVRNDVIVDFLLNYGASEEDAGRIARISGGKAGVASDFWKNPEKMQNYIDGEKEWQRFISGGLDEKFGIIENISAEEGRSIDVLGRWLEYSRQLLVDKYLSVLSAKQEISPNPAALLKFIGSLNLILRLMKSSNVNKKLALENLALEI